jgi:hypothetical protein
VITPETITKKQAKKLVKLLVREARCEVRARLGRFDNLEYANYAIKQIEYKNEIRKLLFGTSDLSVLHTMFERNRKRKRSKG